MEPTIADWISAYAEVFAAVGTVGALWAALIAIRIDKVERARSEVRGFHCWIEPDESRAAAPGTATLVLRIGNRTDEVLYDVRVRVESPPLMGSGEMGWSRGRLAPTQQPEAMEGLSGLSQAGFWLTSGSGAEATFTDGRGNRWHRSSQGRLLRVRATKWWAPWRLEHRLERSSFKWWALRTNWHYRWEDQGARSVNGFPPPWWALDLRWKRWRVSRRDDPVMIPWWKPVARWRSRARICSKRLRAGLCLPWWAVDWRWRYWRSWRRDLRLANRSAKRDADVLTVYQKTGRRPSSNEG